MVSNWILADNLEPFLTTLGWIVGYSYDDDDKADIAEGLLETGGVVSSEYNGGNRAKFTIIYDPDAGSINVSVELPSELEPQVELALAVFQHFQLRGRRGQ